MRPVPPLLALALVGALVGPAAGAASAEAASVIAEDAPIVTARGFGGGLAAPSGAPEMGSAFAFPSLLVTDELLAARGMTRQKREPKRPKAETGRQAADGDSAAAGGTSAGTGERVRGRAHARARGMGSLSGALSGDRARLMLQSLTLPGWGQATLGKPRAALAFALLEAGVWGSFTTFRIQEHMRRETYERTARLFGDIDLSGRDEEYRRIVGLYVSSEEYNRLVVRRDAANLYYGDPAAYDAYVAAHEIRGADAWSWSSEDDLQRYRLERQATQRATQHAHDAFAAAVINRLLSLIHASRASGPRAPDQTSWKVECVPSSADPTAFHLALRADF